MTLTHQIEKYLAWKSTYTSRACINYRPWLVRFAASVGDKPLEEVTLDDVVRYRRWLDEKYQPYTIQLAMVAVHNFFKFWNIQGVPCLSPSLVRVPRTRPKARPVISEDDLTKILDSFKGKERFIDLRNELIIRMLWDTGVRVSELCDMNIEDIDLERREILVRTRKSDRMRQVFWSIETHALLTTYLKARQSLTTASGLFICLSRAYSTNRLRHRSVQTLVTNLGKECNLGKAISPHSFRHGKAHRILRMGGNPKHVQAILGHSDTNPMASFAYLEYDNQELQAVARRFLAE